VIDAKQTGALTFARYAYPPNVLGYCGPEDHAALLEYAHAAVSDGGLMALARGFDGAWPYLQLIAAGSGIDDPLDARVVEAYWIGSPLLDRIDLNVFGRSLEARFRRRAGGEWERLAQLIPAGGIAHHSLHVFGVYPWVGLLRAGHVDKPLHVLDRCRIRWGTVQALANDTAAVSFRPLVWLHGTLGLGAVTTEHVTARRRGRSLAPEIEVGDVVSMHWDWICERLTPSRLAALRRYSNRTLDLVNRLPVPGPAAVLS
jgi:hypothetical protein